MTTYVPYPPTAPPATGGGPGGGGGVTVHGDLSGRSATSAHPISAITDLQVLLDARLESGSNLSDLGNLVAARLNLGLGTAALLASTAFETAGAAAAAEIAAKTYADSLAAAMDAVVFKGVINCSANPDYPAASAGHLYRVSVAGKVGGASGVNVEVGDQLLCIIDNTSAGTQASVGANWSIAQVNVDGAVVGPTSATDSVVALFDGASGKLLKAGSTLGSAAFVSTATFASAAQGVDTRIPTDGSVTTAKIVNANVTLAKLADIATARFLGRSTAGSGTPEELTATQARTLLGLVVGTDVQAFDSDLTAIGALTTTAYGRAFLALVDATAARTALGLGTAATSASSAFETAGAASAAQTAAIAASQPVDSDLTAIAALTTTAYGRAFLALADAAGGRTALGLGTAATTATTAYATAAQGTDARTPTLHASSHRNGGSDALSSRVTFSNADYTIIATTQTTIVQQTGTLSAARIVTLPAASAVPAGAEVIVQAGVGCSNTNTLTINRAGADTINGGATGEVIAAAYGWRRFMSDGTSSWTIDAGLLRSSRNLSDVSDVATARTNLGAVGATDTATLTNKRVTRRVTSIANSATPTINTDSADAVTITAQAVAITSMTTNLTGTPTDFQQLLIRLKDNGTARAITWGASFVARGTALPTTTVATKVTTVGLIWDGSAWGCTAVAQEA